MSVRTGANGYLDLSQVCVLVLDDNAATRTMIGEVLLGLGIRRVLKAQNAEEARAALKTNAIDLIFADIELGGESGLTVVQRVRDAHDPKIAGAAIVMVSSYATEARVIEAGAMGADSFVGKPFSVARLARAIPEALANRQMASRAAAVQRI